MYKFQNMRLLQPVSEVTARVKKELPFTLYVLCPCFCFCVAGILDYGFYEFDLVYVTPNLLLFTTVFLLLWLLTARPRLSAEGTMLFSVSFGVVSHYVMRFKGRGMLPADLASWRTAVNVSGAYDYTPDAYLLWGLLLGGVYLAALQMCPKEVQPVFKRPAGQVVGRIVAVGLPLLILLTPATKMMGIQPQQWEPSRIGTMLNFVVALGHMHPSPPQGYSRDAVEQILQPYAEPVERKAPRPENLIVIMNEAYGDYSIFPGFILEEGDPYEFLHSVDENTVKGYCSVPVFGGGTATTECEALTGLSASFEPMSVTYMMSAHEDMPSIVELAEAAGYSSVSFHPFHASGWNREAVYAYLGFDRQLYMEDVSEPLLIRGLISDESDYRKLNEITDEQDGPTFIFNTTMQNHSGYDLEWDGLDRSVRLPEELKEADPGAEQYFSLIKSSDDALRSLIHYYEDYDETTMIVLFGDHQAALSNEFYDAIDQDSKNERTTEEELLRFKVPFFIWANYDIPERDGLYFSSSYLPVLVAEYAGLPMTPFLSYLKDLMKQLPVISSKYMLTGDGAAYAADDLPLEQQALLAEYAVVNYCALHDATEATHSYFHLSERQGQDSHIMQPQK